MACKDVQQGETAKNGSDCAAKGINSQGRDDMQAKKLRERRQEIVGDISPLQPPHNPDPMAAGPDRNGVGGEQGEVGNIKVGKEGRDQMEVGLSELEQDVRSPARRRGRGRTCSASRQRG